jgi:hypothetical protein
VQCTPPDDAAAAASPAQRLHWKLSLLDDARQVTIGAL